MKFTFVVHEYIFALSDKTNLGCTLGCPVYSIILLKYRSKRLGNWLAALDSNHRGALRLIIRPTNTEMDNSSIIHYILMETLDLVQ